MTQSRSHTELRLSSHDFKVNCSSLVSRFKDHKCHGIPPKKRKDCGSPSGITRVQCEEKDCCFDANPDEGVPACFHGVSGKDIFSNYYTSAR